MKRPRFDAKLPRTYGEMTYASPYWVVRYPHQKRLRVARNTILANRPGVVLDYGAGTGELLFDLIASGYEGRVIAYEPVEAFWRPLGEEVGRRGLRDRIEVVIDRNELRGPFAFVACLEVLEHMPLPEREWFYDLCATHLDGVDARILISVPIEVGPTLLVKSMGRTLLKGRPSEYDWPALLRHSVGAKMYDPARYRGADTRTWITSHKGFDYRMLEQEVRERGFEILERRSTPLGCLPAPLFNQERFLTLRLRSSP